jgi:hypothetical protein
MIQLREDCLLVEQPGGGYLAWSASQLTLEFVGGGSGFVDEETLRHVAAGVLHYFRDELERTTVTVGEFAEALTKVLNGLGFIAEVTEVRIGDTAGVADLRQLASGSGKLGELEFFTKLRETLRQQLAAAPRAVEFRGLRGCVKQLAGRKHWCPTCDRMEAWIVETLRGWFGQEPGAEKTALVVR